MWGHDFANEYGNTPWLDFIREVARQVPSENNPFTDATDNPNKFMGLNGCFSLVAGGKAYPYVEEYWMRETPNHSFKLIFAVFLNNAQQYARIECYDSAWFGLCDLVVGKVTERNS